MSRHRLEPPRRVRPRYGRMAAAGLSLAVTMIALLGGIGVLPVDGSHRPAYADSKPTATPTPGTTNPSATPAPEPATKRVSPKPVRAAAAEPTAETLPEGTGSGRRVVFDIDEQRVWLVDGNGEVSSSYLVSGSVTHNLNPGSYRVYSRSRWAVGIDDSGSMQYFVRFTRGNNAAIGFHSIPTKNGVPLQTEAQLGSPQSHGCIRQRLADAIRLWDFAPVGTAVVVV